MDKSKVILLDPGHGWDETIEEYRRPLMALRNGEAIEVASTKEDPREFAAGFYREDHGTLGIAMFAMKALADMGYEVYCTRSDYRNATAHLKETIKATDWQKSQWKSKSWEWIKAAIRHYKADAFVSIHTNASKGSGVAGFYSDTISAVKGKDLTEDIASEISSEFGLRVRRIAKKNYAILKDACEGSACLIECAFHDNPDELALLLDHKNLERFGQAIARGVDKHLS